MTSMKDNLHETSIESATDSSHFLSLEMNYEGRPERSQPAFKLVLFAEDSSQHFMTFAVPQVTHDSFTRRMDSTIILHPVQSKLQIKKTHNSEKSRCSKAKPVKKIIQKESRNVASNLLRIFFKNVLETDFYGPRIEVAIHTLRLSITKQQFYIWFSSFNINFKNYIRMSQIKQLFSRPACDSQKLVLLLLEDYLGSYAPCHCLTSKRIERSSVLMHLRGLRLLREDIRKWKDSPI